MSTGSTPTRPARADVGGGRRLGRRPGAPAPSVAALLACALLVATLLCALLGMTLAACGGSDDDKTPVTLQLNWYHEAEFIGYYVAQAKGYYDKEGLAVTILEGGPPGPPARESVLNGSATFAITSFAEQRDMIAEGRTPVAVMAGFQIPPLVIFSLAQSGISQPADLVGKKVGTTTDYWKNILRQTLAAAGVDPAAAEAVDVSPDQLSLLYDGTVDAWLGYALDEPIQAQVAGHPVRQIFPADFGIGGYEGLLITMKATIAEDPDLVERFVRASYEGWRYALEHSAEVAGILVDWAGKSLEFQRLAISAVVPLVDVPQVPVGWIDEARWQQLMGEAYDATHPGYTMRFSPVTP